MRNAARATRNNAMTRIQGHVKGTVSYREGDGVMMEIPLGPCEVTIGELDVTLSWTEDDVRGSTAIPKGDFDQFVSSGALVLD